MPLALIETDISIWQTGDSFLETPGHLMDEKEVIASAQKTKNIFNFNAYFRLFVRAANTVWTYTDFR